MIRKYEEKEIPELVEVWELASNLAHPFLSAEFTQMVKNAMSSTYLPNSNTWVYEDSKNILGFISMMDNEIGGLFVRPNQHRKGIGTALINHVSQHFDSLEVEVFEENKIGKPFYQKHGFEVKKTYIQEGTDQVVLRMKRN